MSSVALDLEKRRHVIAWLVFLKLTLCFVSMEVFEAHSFFFCGSFRDHSQLLRMADHSSLGAEHGHFYFNRWFTPSTYPRNMPTVPSETCVQPRPPAGAKPRWLSYAYIHVRIIKAVKILKTIWSIHPSLLWTIPHTMSWVNTSLKPTAACNFQLQMILSDRPC